MNLLEFTSFVLVPAAVASIDVSSASPIPSKPYCDNQIIKLEHIYTRQPSNNILKQAWRDCQNLHSASSLDTDGDLTNEKTSSPSDQAAISESNTDTAKTRRVKRGLPKPKMYNKENKRNKKCQKKKLKQKVRKLQNDISDDEDGTKLISKLEKEIFSKSLNSVETEEMADILTTSTPARQKQAPHTDLPSPIHGLTPLRTNCLFDENFLNPLEDRKCMSLSPDFKAVKSNVGSPDVSLIEISPLVSPDKFGAGHSDGHDMSLSNQNLSRFLSEYGLDSACDNGEQFLNLNWSAVQQMVDSMDTS